MIEGLRIAIAERLQVRAIEDSSGDERLVHHGKALVAVALVCVGRNHGHHHARLEALCKRKAPTAERIDRAQPMQRPLRRRLAYSRRWTTADRSGLHWAGQRRSA